MRTSSRLLLKTFYLLRQQKKPSRSPLISLEVYCDCADCFIFSWKKLKAKANFSARESAFFSRMKNLHTKRSMKRKLIWVSWFGNCQSIKTDGGRRFTEGLYQTLISFHLARRNVIYRAKPSQVTWWSIKEAGSKGEICHVHFLLKSHWITVSSIWDRVIWVFWVESTFVWIQ